MAPRPPNLSRRLTVIAGWSENEPSARSSLELGDAVSRASALAALARMDALSIADLQSAVVDDQPLVRRRALLLLPDRWSEESAAQIDLVAALHDDDPTVLEVACFVAGECVPTNRRVVQRLMELCVAHDDPLCRESAVAALGSLGDPEATAAVLTACDDRATVRRRAVLALTAFDGADVDAKLAAMAEDVDWQVRQAAEELLAIGSDP